MMVRYDSYHIGTYWMNIAFVCRCLRWLLYVCAYGEGRMKWSRTIDEDSGLVAVYGRCGPLDPNYSQ